MANPFASVRSDLRQLKREIKDLIEHHVGGREATKEGSTNPLLQEAAKEFFERRERAWRPCMVLLMARALEPASLDQVELQRRRDKQMQLAEIVELMATAQVIHDDVLEDFEEQEAGNVAHRMYSSALGNKISLLAGDFLLARSSVALAKLVNVQVVEIIGRSLENMCRGDIMEAQALVRDKLNATYYHQRASLKTASLVADACRCTAILWGYDSESPTAEAAWTYGMKAGIAYSIAHDLTAFDAAFGIEAGADQGKPAFLPSPEAMQLQVIALPPYWLAAEACPELEELALRGFSNSGDVELAAQCLFERTNARQLALDSARVLATESLSALTEIADSEYKLGLAALGRFVSEEDQTGLQRQEWRDIHRKGP